MQVSPPSLPLAEFGNPLWFGLVMDDSRGFRAQSLEKTCFFLANGFSSGQSGITSAKLVFLRACLGVDRVWKICTRLDRV